MKDQYPNKPNKIAIIHDWLTLSGGAESTLKQILNIYPDADFYTLLDFMPPDQKNNITLKTPQVSFLQKLPFTRKHYRSYLPLMPLAIEQFDLNQYDLVISSSYAVAKGAITGPDQLHISYIYTPLRYAWDMQNEYLQEARLQKGVKSILTRLILHYLRGWDTRTNNIDHIIAISHFIARRIWKYYRRPSTVIYPPVDVNFYTLNEIKENYYLCVSRMVQYKRVDLIVEAFCKMPEKNLIVMGDGPELTRIQAKSSSNITITGYQPREILKKNMQNAKALIFAAKEDFGIVPVEAQACGTPVIAYGKGGSLETVNGLDQNNPTGLFFSEQNVDAIIGAVQWFETNRSTFNPWVCRKNAEKFGVDRFQKEFEGFVDNAWVSFNQAKRITDVNG